MSSGINIPTTWTEVKALIDSGWRLYHSKQQLGTRFNYAVYCTNDEPGGVSFNTNLKSGSSELIDFETNYLVFSNKPFVPGTVLDTATNTFVPNTVQILQTSIQSVIDPVTNTVVPLTIQQVGTISIAPNENSFYLKEDFLNLALSNEMAINGLPTNSFNIWDGSGVDDVGTPDFTHTETGTVTEKIVASHSGTNGLEVLLGDKQYIDFSGSVDISVYEIFTFWINVQAGWEDKDKLEIKLFLSGAQQGKKINIRNYMIHENEGIWQQVIIPVQDFNKNSVITNIDKIQLKADEDKNFYFDDFVISTNGSGNTDLKYSVYPASNEKYLIDLLNITIITNSKSDKWEPLNFSDLAELNNGIDLRLFKNNSLFKTIKIKNNSEILSLSSKIKGLSGKINSAKSFDLMFSVVVDGSKSEWIEIIVNDNLSKIKSIKASVIGSKVDL